MSIRYFTVLLPFAALGLMTQPALAQQIHAGSAAGSYTNDFCPQVEEALRAEYFEHQCTTSDGSGDNVAKVLATPTDVGLGQFDVVAAANDDNPGKLAVVDPGIGLECLYAVTSSADVDSLQGLSPRMPVALPPERSGSSETFRYLQSLDENLEQMRSITHHESALSAVEAVVSGDAALAFFVQFPNTNNSVFQTINDAELKFVPVINRPILRREVAGQQVYQPQEVVVTPAGMLGQLTGNESDKVLTTCMPVVLFSGDPSLFPESSAERQDQQSLIEQLAATEAPSGGDWTDVFRNAVTASRERVESLLDR